MLKTTATTVTNDKLIRYALRDHAAKLKMNQTKLHHNNFECSVNNTRKLDHNKFNKVSP